LLIIKAHAALVMTQLGDIKAPPQKGRYF